MKTFIFLAMLFCHIIDDYTLQGWLANAKQREWWQKNAPSRKYRYDYLMALIMHSISWSFMIMLPIAVYLRFDLTPTFICMFISNVLIHASVDDAKANQKTINLVCDQLIHILQIIVTFFACFIGA